MSVFTVTPSGEAVGWSVWPWEPLYSPAVGVFLSGRLVGAGACDREKPRIAKPPSLQLHARVRRRLLRELRITPSQGPEVALEGPRAPVWFRIALPPETAARLRRGDPTVRLERLEDGAALRHADAPGDHAPAAPRTGPVPVESLLDDAPSAAPLALDGFAAFLTNPPAFQLQAVFMEYLRRFPDPLAVASYLPPLQDGRFTVLTIRNLVFVSDEFRSRRVGYGARLGATMTSHAWRRLAELPTLGSPWVPLPRLRVCDYDGRPSAEFVRDACAAMVEGPVSPEQLAEYVAVSDGGGRRELAVELSRAAARRGRFLEIV